MRSSLRRLLRVVLLLAVALAFLGAAALLVLDRAATPARAEALLRDALGVEVRVGGVETAWLPPSVVVTDVDAAPALRVGRARIDPALGALLRGRLAVGELHLERGELSLLLREDGGVAFATGAPGGVPLGEGGPGAPRAALPDVHVREATLTLHDAAGARPPLHVEVARLDLDALPLVGVRVRLRASLGPGGRHGRVELGGRASGLAGLGGGDAQEGPELRLRLRVRELEADALGGWLPADAGVRAGPARLDLDLELEGRRREAFDARAELSRGRIEVGPLELGAPATAAGRLVDAPSGLRLEDASLDAARATWNGLRSGPLRAGFAWRPGALDVRDLDVEDLRAAAGSPSGAAMGLDLHVARTEQLTLAGLQLGHDAGTPSTVQRLEAAGIELVLEPGAEGEEARGLPLRVERLVVRDFAPGRTASLRAEARVGATEAGRGGTLRVEGRYGPWAPGGAVRAQPLALTLALEDVDAARLAALLPAAWRVTASPDAALDATADLEGPRPDALGGRATVALRGGGAELAGLRIEGPAQLAGRLGLADAAGTDGRAAPVFRDAWLEAAGAALGPVRAGATEARFAWDGSALDVERASLARVRLDEGAARLGAASGEGASLAVHDAASVTVEGLRWPGDPAAPIPWLPRRVVATDCALAVDPGLRPGAPDLELAVRSLEAAGLEAGGRASVTVDGRLRDDAGGAAVRGHAALAPFAPRAPLAPQIRELALELEDADVASLTRLLPAAVAPDAASGRLDATLELSASGDDAAEGRLALSLREGAVRLAALRLPAPARLDAALGLSHEGVPTLGDVTLEAAGGTWRQRGRLVLGETPSLDARYDVEGVAAWEALELETRAARAGAAPPASPRLDGQLTVRGPLEEGAARFGALRGEGRLALTGGELPSSELLLSVAHALARQVGVPPGDGATRRTPLRTAAATLALEGGRLLTDDLAIDTREYTLTGRGHVTLEGAVALETLVSFRPAGVTRLLGVLDVTRPITGDLLRLPPVPVAIGGTLADPRFRPEATRLPVAWARSLLGLPGKALESVTETGRRLGRGLGDLLPGQGSGDGDAEGAAPRDDAAPAQRP